MKEKEKRRFVYSIESLITCKLNRGHLIDDPVKLPCGYSACRCCVAESISRFGCVKCDFEACSTLHHDIDPNFLECDRNIDRLINDNLRLLTEVYLKLLRKSFCKFNSKFLFKKKKVLLFQYFYLFEAKISESYEYLCNQQDIGKCDEAKMRVIGAFKSSFMNAIHEIISNSDLIEDMHTRLVEYNFQSVIKVTEDTLKQDIVLTKLFRHRLYKCYEYLMKLKNLEAEFYHKCNLNKLKAYEQNQHSFQNLNTIYELHNDIENINTALTQNAYPFPNISLEDVELSEPMLVSDKSFTSLSSESTKEDTDDQYVKMGVCSDEFDNIFLVDFVSNRVLKIAKDFSRISLASVKVSNNFKNDSGMRFIQTLFL